MEYHRFYLVNAAVTDLEGHIITSEPQCVPGNTTVDAMMNADISRLLLKDYGREDLMTRVFIEREMTKEEYELRTGVRAASSAAAGSHQGAA